ncbi:MAG TPA: hypothetical protein VN704_12695 [Verrucomicrobiae bacterium]|jgi:hypothetical protein|nr:hypothetical protein [Verrucomicrobiae bacterium]
MEEKEVSKKTEEQIFVDVQQQQQQQETGFAIVSLDESFFFCDSLVRQVWIEKNKRPIVKITGSHQYSCIFGAISTEEGKQIFRQYDVFNGDTFLKYLKRKYMPNFKMLSVYG